MTKQKSKPYIDTRDPNNYISLAELRKSGMLDRLTMVMFGKTVEDLRKGRQHDQAV